MFVQCEGYDMGEKIKKCKCSSVFQSWSDYIVSDSSKVLYVISLSCILLKLSQTHDPQFNSLLWASANGFYQMEIAIFVLKWMSKWQMDKL